MRDYSRKRDYEDLRRQIEGYGELLAQLRQKESSLDCFDSWTDVLSYMHEGTWDVPLKDSVLGLILHAHKEDGDPRWRTILLGVFWRNLEALHYLKRRYDPDPKEFWPNIIWAFLQVICNWDAARHRQEIGRKIHGDVTNLLYRTYERKWRTPGLEFLDDKDLIEIAGAAEDTRFRNAESEEHVIGKLAFLRDVGVISESDFLLIIGTRVYDRALADFARSRGLNYQRVKKQRQRAESNIRDYFKRFQKNLGTLSPSPDSSALFH